MKIVISGYGKMGRMIENIALKLGHKIVSTVDPKEKSATHKEICPDATKGSDLIIDFSLPDTALKNIKKAVECKANMVMGTTGWYKNEKEARKIVGKKIGFIFAPNFSLGVNLFACLLEKATQIMDPFREYDIFSYEMHHRRKVDSPSGTALLLGEKVIKNSTQKRRLTLDRLNRKIRSDELHVASIRGGEVPGTHAFVFDSGFDSIELKHTARSREGWALGAILAGEWLLKSKKGFFTVNDWLGDILQQDN